MQGISKWQKGFLEEVFLLYLSMSGRVNFLQMGRQGKYHEQTYRNQFSKSFDFMRMNKELIKAYGSGSYILAFDPSYIRKSGKHTPGLGYFYSGCSSRYERGLEIGGLAAIDIKQNTAYHLEATQSPSANRDRIQGSGSLIDHYAKLIINRVDKADSISNILVVDGYFSRTNFINPVCQHTGVNIISRLRDDANLRYLYHGLQKGGRGRPKKYAGKVDVNHIDKRRFPKVYDDEQINIYSAVVNSVSLGRNIKVAYVEFKDQIGNVAVTKMFYSTDLSMNAQQIFQYYRARFQIEFLYRDAKQYTGLEHCQARDEKKLHFHFNASLTAISLGKIIIRDQTMREQKMCLSIADVKTELMNRKMIVRIFSMYGFDPNLIKNNLTYRKLLNFGKIAA